MEETKTFMVEDGRIIFRNFSGEGNAYNKAGERNFCAILDPDTAEKMVADDWLVKQLKSREEGVEGDFYIQVKVGFKYKPPKIVLLTDTSRTTLTEEMVGILDWVDIRVVDFICRAVDWDINGKQGIKAYLQTMFVTINEDYLESKYAITEGN